MYLITFLCISIIRILFILKISDVHKDLSSLLMKNWNQKYKLKTNLFIIGRQHFNLVFDLLKEWIQMLPKLYKYKMGWGSLRFLSCEVVYKKV